MEHCPACKSAVPVGSRYCPSCAAPVSSGGAELTQTSLSEDGSVESPASLSAGASQVSSSLASQDGSRFIPGTVLAGRYRIVGLLGKGGMGEVYRADDLKLGQAVALKLLPPALEQDPDRLQRFLNEARTALKVTHANVCRVYDLGEVEGSHYLSMEFVDGEDLASLLRRIGRLPGDKAAQIARQLCAGLAAAHDQGILHRDLKPANVMIDGRGRVRITDFGLAGLAEDFRGAEVRAGTPAYMAPEQLTGKEVTVRSDLYSLGLVLYELFTGKPAFHAPTAAELVRLHQESAPVSPASLVDRMDDSVERVILHCLEKNPADRPASALAVAAALPGGDPLAAALAAGETPSPEMVAAAGPQGGLRPAVALACLAAGLIGLVVTMIVKDRTEIYNTVPLVKSYEALRENAREIIGELGYTDSPADSVAWFDLNAAEVRHLAGELEPAEVSARMAEPGQGILRLYYRQSARHIVPRNLTGGVSENDPPLSPGDILLEVDLQGRMTYLEAVPARRAEETDGSREIDWALLFETAGLELENFRQVDPEILPPVFADERKAWTGILPGRGEEPIRIEAAALAGQPVYFHQIVPSDPLAVSDEESENASGEGIRIAVISILLLAILMIVGGAVFLAVRSLRLGRGDRSGAMRIAVTIFFLHFLDWLLTAHHVAGLGEFYSLVLALVRAIAFAVLTWVLYIALEPYIRRLWPQSIVSWTRLLSGRRGDPLVGRDLLFGFVFGIGLSTLSNAALATAYTLFLATPVPNVPVAALRGGRYAFGIPFSVVMGDISFALCFLMLVLFLKLLLRKMWIAAAAVVAMYAIVQSLSFSIISGEGSVLPAMMFGLVLGTVLGTAVVVLLTRFGLLAAITAFVVADLISSFPVTADFSAPYFAASLLGPLLGVAIAVYAVRISLAGRSLFAEEVLD